MRKVERGICQIFEPTRVRLNAPVRSTLVGYTLVIMAIFDRLGAQNMIELITIWLLVNPFLHCVEHVSVDLETLVSESWVMESSADITHHLINRDTGILPGIEDSTS